MSAQRPQYARASPGPNKIKKRLTFALAGHRKAGGRCAALLRGTARAPRGGPSDPIAAPATAPFLHACKKTIRARCPSPQHLPPCVGSCWWPARGGAGREAAEAAGSTPWHVDRADRDAVVEQVRAAASGRREWPITGGPAGCGSDATATRGAATGRGQGWQRGARSRADRLVHTRGFACADGHMRSVCMGCRLG